jgi:hypothetical protein
MNARIATTATFLTFLALALALAVAAAPQVTAGKPAAPVQPDRVTIGSLSAWYGAVDFTHAKHAELSGDCTSCHHNTDGQAVTCATCHPEQTDPGSPSTMTLKVAYHQRCMACHKAAGSGPVGCTECHSRKALPAPTSTSASVKR